MLLTITGHLKDAIAIKKQARRTFPHMLRVGRRAVADRLTAEPRTLRLVLHLGGGRLGHVELMDRDADRAPSPPAQGDKLQILHSYPIRDLSFISCYFFVPALVWEISKDRIQLASSVILGTLSFVSCVLGATLYSRSLDEFGEIRLKARNSQSTN
jgi:hypothetical protein